MMVDTTRVSRYCARRGLFCNSAIAASNCASRPAEGRIEMLLLHRAPDDVERLPASVMRVGREVLRNLPRFLRESLNAERKAHYERQNRLFHKAFSYRDQVVVINISEIGRASCRERV